MNSDEQPLPPNEFPDAAPPAAATTTPDATQEHPATTFGNRYVIMRELGRGGIGIVYLARDAALMNRLVVIKVMQDEVLENEWVLQKFRQEIEALTRLNHPGIVAVYDAGETPEGKPYIVMQYVEGTTLRAALTPEGLPLEHVAYIMRRIGRALSAAHDKGILHRDLKPENVMLESGASDDEEAKLIDFGIAKIKNSVIARSTVLPNIAGTTAYMSPEQLERRPYTAASDIYALGVMAYEMVTGRRPFNPETQFQLLEMQRAGVCVKPCDLRPALSSAAQEAILKALEFEPERRYARARDFGDALAQTLNVAFASEARTRRFDEAGANDPNAAAARPPQQPPPHLPPTRPSASAASPSSSPTVAAPGADDDLSLTLEMAYVLFTDIVGYSRRTMDQQPRLLRQLQNIVRHTPQFAAAHAADQLITLPSGDGMALVFFTSSPLPAVECALEIARQLRGEAQLPVRMGVHAGPVYRVADINLQNNVAGGGINLAQRVMDCGDAGHILVSQTVAEVLRQLSQWQERLHDLGEAEVKHGERIHLYNLYTEEAGNPAPPAKLISRSGFELEQASPIPVDKPRLPTAAIVAGALLLCAVVVGALFWSSRPPDTPAASNANANANVAAAPPVERTLNFWLTVQKMKDGREDGAPFQSEGRDVFTDGWRFRMNVSAKDAGYFYLLNEPPAAKDRAIDAPRYQVLFPSPKIKAGDARLPAGEIVTVPSESWYFFTGAKDGERGTEKMWMVWSKEPLAAFEDLKNVRAESNGVRAIRDPRQVDAVQKFLTQNSTDPTLAERDRQKRQTLIRGKGATVVHAVELEHQ
ncbi:MAG TPA: protein kinase [Pyrinomonadaceae bacterium]|jgi:serine/threonine-protein kinase